MKKEGIISAFVLVFVMFFLAAYVFFNPGSSVPTAGRVSFYSILSDPYYYLGLMMCLGAAIWFIFFKKQKL